MKTLAKLLGAILVLGSVDTLPAQETAPEPMIAAAARFDATQLDQLLGPVALYPDALIALILPASAASSDVVLAARYLRDGGDPAQLDNQPWDESVRALARYPEVIKWMDENLAWTKQLGEAFVAQPTEVMNAVQRLRATAQAAGTLTNTPQQQVVVEQSTISIVPTQPDVIYVPYYDPAVVYVSQPPYYASSFIRFGPAYASGFWLSYNLDWSSRRVCYVDFPDRQRYWHDHPDYWRRPYFSNRPGYVSLPNRTWTPRPGSTYFSRHGNPAPRPPTPAYQSGFVNNVPHWQGREEIAGPRVTSSAPRANALPNAAFARSLPATPNVAAPQMRLANPLPQPMPAPLPAAPQTGWTHNNNGNALRYRSQPVAPVGPAVPNYQSSSPRIVAPPLQTANAYAHAPRYQAPVPSAPAFAPRPPPAPAVQAPPPANNPAPRGSDGSNPGYQRGRDRFER